MKKIIALLLAVLMVLSMVACASKTTDDTPADTTPADTTPADTTTGYPALLDIAFFNCRSSTALSSAKA